MELDELKKAWIQSDDAINRGNRDILELIQNESAGPAAKLKRRFKKGMILIPLITGIGITELSKQNGFMTHPLTWYLLVFCISMMIYFYLNYRIMSRMQVVDGKVKDNLKTQVQLLSNGLRWRLLITRGLFLSFIFLTELIMYFKLSPEFDKWHQQSAIVRLGAYAGYIIFLYFLTKFATDFRYKKHIVHLNDLIEQMQ